MNDGLSMSPAEAVFFMDHFVAIVAQTWLMTMSASVSSQTLRPGASWPVRATYSV